MNWRTIEENDFNSLVEALLVRENSGGGLVAQALDGRGGDGGVDIDVRVEKTGQLVRVYQLKWFPGGFSGGFRGRRAQIKESFEKALSSTDMTVWYLVVPTNLTPNERRYLSTLPATRRVFRRAIGRTELDLLSAKYPLIRTSFERSATGEALAIFGRESAALAQPGDAGKEVRHLYDRIENRSAYWRTEFDVQDGVVTERLSAKRSDAAEREPLRINISTRFDAANSALAKKFMDGINFGVIDPILLPAEVVTSFEKLGPAWFAEDSGPGELQILPSEEAHSPLRISISTRSESGSTIATLTGFSERVARGGLGGTIMLRYAGGLTHTWRVAQDYEIPSNTTLAFTPGGHSATLVRRAIRFVDSFSIARSVIMQSGDKKDVLNLVAGSAKMDVGEAVRQLADDMAYIENALDIEFLYPVLAPDNSDRVWVRVIRRLLEGKVVAVPFTESFVATLSGTLSEAFRVFLSTPSPIVLTEPDWAMEIFDQQIELGSVSIYHPSVKIDDGASHLEALLEGTGRGREFVMRPSDGSPFRIYMPSTVEDDDLIVAEAWSVPGVREHPGLEVRSGAAEQAEAAR